MTLRVEGLGKRYRSTWALRDCEFEVPEGKVAALVGANGAGKTTLLSVLAGLTNLTEGSVHIDGRIAFVAQDKPVYRHFHALDMLRLGASLNREWDQQRALDWLNRFQVPLQRSCGKLSGGQRAQVAFAVALGSQPDVLLLDEPLSELDPLVRREAMAELLAQVADRGMTLLMSTHVVTELGGVADHLLLLAGGKLLVSGDLDELLDGHVHCTGPRAEAPPVPGEVLETRHEARQSRFLVKVDGERPAVAEPWTTQPVSIEDLVLAHLSGSRS